VAYHVIRAHRSLHKFCFFMGTNAQVSALRHTLIRLDLYPIPSTVDQKCLGKNTNQLQGKNYKVKIQTKYKRE
jgi:hypothetical protein